MYGCEFLSGGGNSLQLATGSSENVYLWDVETATRLSEAGPPTDLRDIAGGMSLPLEQPQAAAITLFTRVPQGAGMLDGGLYSCMAMGGLSVCMCQGPNQKVTLWQQNHPPSKFFPEPSSLLGRLQGLPGVLNLPQGALPSCDSRDKGPVWAQNQSTHFYTFIYGLGAHSGWPTQALMGNVAPTWNA